MGIEPAGFGRLARGLVYLGERQLIANPAGRSGIALKHASGAVNISHAQQRLRFEFRYLHIEDAVGVAFGKAFEQLLGGRVIAAIVLRLRSQKFFIIGQCIAGCARLAQVSGGFGKVVVEQIGVTERQVSGRRCLPVMLAGVGGYTGVSRRGACDRQLLRHRA